MLASGGNGAVLGVGWVFLHDYQMDKLEEGGLRMGLCLSLSCSSYDRSQDCPVWSPRPARIFSDLSWSRLSPPALSWAPAPPCILPVPLALVRMLSGDRAMG